MTIGMRRIMVGMFTLVFAVVGSALVVTGSGYRYHPQKRTFEKTGQIVVETIPAGAKILLNGNEQSSGLWLVGASEKRTPMTIPAVLAGEYELEILKQGFHAWKGRVRVNAGEVSMLSRVRLIRASEPRVITRVHSLQSFEVLKNGDILVVARNSLSILPSGDKQEKKNLFSPKEEIESITLSPLERAVLIRGRKRTWVVDYVGTIYDLSLLKTVFRSYVWTPSDDLLGLNEEGVWHIAYDEYRASRIYPSQLRSLVFVRDRALAIHESDPRSISVLRIQLDKNTIQKEQQISLSRNAKAFFSPLSWGSGIALDGGNMFLKLVGREGRLIELGDIAWAHQIDERRFLARGDFEVWEYVLSDSSFDRTLVTREGSRLREVLPIGNGEIFALVLEDGTLRMRTRQPSGFFNDIRIQTGVRDIKLDRDGDMIAHVRRDGTDELIELKLLEE